MSWLIAACSFVSSNLTLAGRFITIGTFLSCLPLTYWLAFKLWRSHVVASAAVLWFTVARGLLASSVCLIVADFLLTACVLIYFSFLLSSLRDNSYRRWFLVSVAHGVAFLAKAFAMPWLALTTIAAVTIQNWGSFSKLWRTAVFALIFPALVWVGWGELLKTKLGVFTAGYQLRYNLLVNTRRSYLKADSGSVTYPFLTEGQYDEYMVTQPPDGWNSPLLSKHLIPTILNVEAVNVPRALKEITILLTPGGLLALYLALRFLVPYRSRFDAEYKFALLVIFSAMTLVVAYCMLVFDDRYVWPLIPVFMAISARFLVPRGEIGFSTPVLQRAALALTVIFTVFFTLYWASPFRTIDRDFQASCRDAASQLQRLDPHGRTLVSLGQGPYPEHGVGWEVELYAAYFADRRVVAVRDTLPPPSDVERLARAVLDERAGDVLVWGVPGDSSYQALVSDLQRATGAVSAAKVHDPRKGEVGTAIVFSGTH